MRWEDVFVRNGSGSENRHEIFRQDLPLLWAEKTYTITSASS